MDLSDCRKFFLEPDNPKQRMYEAPRAQPGVLYLRTARTSFTAKKIRRARLDHRTAQTKSFRLRDQRSSQRAEVSPQSDGCSGSSKRGRVRSASTASGYGTSGSPATYD